MNRKNKVCAFIAAASLAITLSACSDSGSKAVAYLENPPEGSKNEFVITYDQWYSEYKFNLLNGGFSEENDPEAAKSYRESILDYQVREKIVLYLAKEMEITAEGFTEEEILQVNEGAERMMESAKLNREEAAKAELGDAFTEAELSAKEEQLLEELLKECGYTADIFTTWKTNEMIQQKFIEKASEAVTEEQIDALVNENVERAKEYYLSDNAVYEQYYTAFYIPEGSRIVQQIVVLIDETARSQITAYRNGGDDEMADSLLEEELKKIKPQIDEAYQKLQSGEKWETVQEQYNQDENTGGVDFTVFPQSSSVKQDIIDTAMSVEKKGGYSEIAQSDSGYYILLYKDDAAVTQEDMDSLREQAEEYLRDEEAYKKIEDFQAKYTYVYDYKLLDLDDPNA
ncbi:MAG: peptidylprolyl isomerase [Firmicutes bacterium]|nr:peptidylprolyl isomerase [[Eubacterium] siraeum]MCM1487159.1 peptidylprolyl isomerase [Bacillota bacterium]